MKNKLSEAMEQISDKHIAEAANPKKKIRRPVWFSAAAAFLVIILAAAVLSQPLALSAAAVAQAEYPEYQYLQLDHDIPILLQDFFQRSMGTTLSGLEGENGVYSPLNLTMALSVLAELTTGEARQQILTAMNAPDMDTLRIRANTLWRASHYDKNNQTLLANSLWLDDSVDFNQDVMNILAENYYTSSYRGDLGSKRTNRLISQWLDQQTGNMLKRDTARVQLPEDIVLALYSTVYFQAKWSNDFSAGNNKDGIFHAPNGDRTVTYMNKTRMNGLYYWAEDFGATSLSLKDGSQMWLFLPDVDKTVDDILASGDYLDMIRHDTGNSKAMFINLSIPKFDIRQNCDLREDLESMGIAAVFDREAGAFTDSVFGHDYGTDVWLTAANQATRVAIDEKGVTAASYIEFPGAGAAAPPDDEIDFILDRPFFFVIARRELPLFAGVVNEP